GRRGGKFRSAVGPGCPRCRPTGRQSFRPASSVTFCDRSLMQWRPRIYRGRRAPPIALHSLAWRPAPWGSRTGKGADAMIDYNALLICMTAFATGFAVAWAIAGKTREQLAALQARADAQVQAAEDKLELVTEAKTTLANAFKALSAEALNASNQS